MGLQKVESDEPSAAEGLLTEILEQLVGWPEALFVKAHETQYSASFDILVHVEDAELLLGNRGDLIRSLRLLFSAIYGRQDKRILLNVVNPRR